MNPLEWNDAWNLGFAPMDELQRQFVERLASAQQASNSELADSWRALLAHTREQFTTEDAWIRQSRFVAATHHSLQHRLVFNLLLQGQAQLQQGDLAAARQLLAELATWWHKHHITHNTALAEHLRQQTRRTSPNRSAKARSTAQASP